MSILPFVVDEVQLSPAATPALQLRTLHCLFRRIAEEAREGVRPVVEVDIDLCALMPICRTEEALRTTGREFGIADFQAPDSLPVVPGYSDEAWDSFLVVTGLEGKYPRMPWRHANGSVNREPDSPFGRFHDLYWMVDLLVEDTPTPGLGAFVHRVEELGGTVVFISGRWRPEHVEPTRACLRRAGIPTPHLVIGNPWHETYKSERGSVLSDAECKVRHQAELSQYGQPVAIIDDRRSNREAISLAHNCNLQKIAIAIPGFSFASESLEAQLRISTFETFDNVVGQAPKRRLITERYPDLGLGTPWRGVYEGLGKNGLAYIVPRNVSPQFPRQHSDGSKTPPFVSLLSSSGSQTFEEMAFLEECLKTIPVSAEERLRQAFAEAESYAASGLAAAFPETDQDRKVLWTRLIANWLHARDVERVMWGLGFDIQAEGVHDLEEYVEGREILTSLQAKRNQGIEYSAWLLQWLESVDPDARVNVGFLNPALLVSCLRWEPETVQQDAMDVHRVSDHHDGDGAERHDPLEAVVNNLLHQREGRFGLRKEPVASWSQLEISLRRESEAESLGKNSVGRNLLRDAVKVAQSLETEGWITPWSLVKISG